MGISERLRKGFRLLFYPAAESKGNYGIKKSLKFFYTVAVLGFIFAAIVTGIVYALGDTASTVTLFSNMGFYYALIGLAVSVFVLTPVGIFVNAAIYQLVGKFFLKAWKGMYEKTFAAVTAASAPVLLLYWLISIPVAGLTFAILISIWEFIILVVALSVQQRAARTSVVVVALITFGIIMAIVMAFVLPVILSHLSALGAGALSAPPTIV